MGLKKKKTRNHSIDFVFSDRHPGGVSTDERFSHACGDFEKNLSKLGLEERILATQQASVEIIKLIIISVALIS